MHSILILFIVLSETAFMAAINTRIARNCSPMCSYKQGVHDAVDKNIGPPTHYTYSSWPAMETQRVISHCTAFGLMLMPEEFRSSAVIESGEIGECYAPRASALGDSTV